VDLGDLELRRLRIERWRVVYVIDEEWELVTILAVRQRPPYDYEDLEELLAEIG
jgi:mRNA interferase RelE/StbE